MRGGSETEVSTLLRLLGGSQGSSEGTRYSNAVQRPGGRDPFDDAAVTTALGGPGRAGGAFGSVPGLLLLRANNGGADVAHDHVANVSDLPD